MPELPEVEVIRRGLEPAVLSAIVSGVDVFDARSHRRHDSVRGDFATVLAGRQIQGIARRGKFLWCPLDTTEALLVHLGMSGQLLLREPGVSDRNTRIRLTVESPNHGELIVNFADQRIFGSMAIDRLVPAGDGRSAGETGRMSPTTLIPSQVAHIARDPLDPDFDDALFIARTRRRRSGVKRALLDQGLVSGIGNIYADEALWEAHVHGEQLCHRMSAKTLARVLEAVRSVMRRALAEGGTSFDVQYVDVNGRSGYFSRSLNVYGREGYACRRCGDTLRRQKFMNRSSHFCATCQRRY